MKKNIKKLKALKVNKVVSCSYIYYANQDIKQQRNNQNSKTK